VHPVKNRLELKALFCFPLSMAKKWRKSTPSYGKFWLFLSVTLSNLPQEGGHNNYYTVALEIA
jgi:hypothetical protein